MKYDFNGKQINIPNEELEKLMETLELSEEEAIATWLDDNDYTTNQEVEELTKKAKVNGTTKIKARENLENKKVERERKANPNKAFIISQIYSKLTEIEGITSLKVENKEKIIIFKYNNNEFKVDLVQKRAKKEGI